MKIVYKRPILSRHCLLLGIMVIHNMIFFALGLFQRFFLIPVAHKIENTITFEFLRKPNLSVAGAHIHFPKLKTKRFRVKLSLRLPATTSTLSPEGGRVAHDRREQVPG